VPVSPVIRTLESVGATLETRLSTFSSGAEVPTISWNNRALVRHYLHGQPLDIRFVDDGQQAVDAVTGEADFDLILMDLDMPVMDGHSAVRKIRQWEAFSERSPVPIVALSAHAIVEEVRSCPESRSNYRR